MRDILDLFRERTQLIVSQSAPTLPNFDGDAVAIEPDYQHQNSAEVAVGLRAAALAYAAELAQVTDNEWGRTGYRSDGREFTVTLADPVRSTRTSPSPAGCARLMWTPRQKTTPHTRTATTMMRNSKDQGLPKLSVHPIPKRLGIKNAGSLGQK